MFSVLLEWVVPSPKSGNVKTDEKNYREGTEDIKENVETFNPDEPTVISTREVYTEFEKSFCFQFYILE